LEELPTVTESICYPEEQRGKVCFMLQFLIAATSAFYLPGVAPKDYRKEEIVPLLVNALTARDSLLPYDYYHSGFNFCKPKDGIVSQRESLGSILFGDRLFTSEFKVQTILM
jgi:transmembrane 9 superfamily protein 2/4